MLVGPHATGASSLLHIRLTDERDFSCILSFLVSITIVQNATAAGAAPQTPLLELTMVPQCP